MAPSRFYFLPMVVDHFTAQVPSHS
jgi:hypothetical protein